MRPVHSLPLVAAILLGACGGGDDLAADGEVTEEELAAAAAIQPEPGQYRTATELVEFDIPGMPQAQADQLRAAFGSGLSQGNEFCLTPEDAAANGGQRMLENLAESDCTFARYVVDGGAIDAEMQCQAEGGRTSAITMTGTVESERSDMTMTMEHDLPGVGKARMTMRARSERIGDCA